MKLAVMQPYLFPYLGYFQLLAAVDTFVVYDDVAFIKQGWINRNNIRVGGKPLVFSVPLRDASSFKRICDTGVDPQGYAAWLRKFFMTVDQNYQKAPCYAPVRQLLERVFGGFEGSIGELALRSIRETSRYLDIRTTLVPSSRAYGNDALTGTARVIDICVKEGADVYINAIGGRELYVAPDFEAHGIALRFIRPRPVSYQQTDEHFVPGLSIIDVMMFNPPDRVPELLGQYDLVESE